MFLPGTNGKPPEMESLLTCPICLDLFTKPVVILPCQHCLCRQCAEDCFDKRGQRFGISGGRFKCPTCRYEVVLDRHGIFGLQRNLLVENIIDMLENEKKKTEDRIVEEQEKEREKEVKTHMKEINEALEKSSKSCNEHQELLNVYCLTCQKLICATCKVFGDCQHCTVTRVETAYEQQQNEISEAINFTTGNSDRVQNAIQHCADLRSRTQEINTDTNNAINSQFNSLIESIEKKRKELTTRVGDKSHEIESKLALHQKKYADALSGANQYRVVFHLIENSSHT